MTTVILAEKPSVALDIARVVGATERRGGYLASSDGSYRVTWALGHLVGLAPPEEIRAEWRRWSALPILPERFPLVPRPDGPQRAQLAVVERLFRSRSTKLIVNAADAGREGELIFRYILEWVFGEHGCDKPIKRFWASSLTEEAIREALSTMRSSAAYDKLASAARMRGQLDWLVGMNGTRALRAFGGRGALPLSERKNLTVGRVQTPTLAMIVRADEAIRTFVPKPYSEVQATFDCEVPGASFVADGSPSEPTRASITATYVRLREDERGVPKWDARLWPALGEEPLSPAEDAEQVCTRARQGSAVLKSVQRESQTYRPPLLFDLTSLQREANVRWGWTASRTLTVAQELYEKHKLLSYPRTDARHLSTTVAEQLPSVVAAIRGRYEALLVPDTGAKPLGRRFVDDAKVSDHHAIIPTSRATLPLAAGSDAGQLYDLVCRRLLAGWQPDCIEASCELAFEVSHGGIADRYMVRGTDVVEPGWRRLEPKTKGSTAELPPGLRAGLVAVVEKAEVLKKRTQPPKPFNEATLLSAMESAGRTLQGAAAEAMRERGLGTPATRAGIIENLVARGYVVRDGRALKSTALGALLIANVCDLLKRAELTGDMEARLRKIEQGAESADSVAADVRALVEALVEAHRPEERGVA